MSELRQDPTTREWVIIAPERAKRPKQAAKKRPAVKLPAWDAACPFCKGNEDQTPEEVFRLPATSQGPTWDVRVVPNRFAALMPEGDPTRQRDGHFFHKMNGFGVHEVIIENPVHNISMALMTCEQLEKVLITYQERYNALKKNRRLKFITIFKNHGWASGTSLVHPHSQLVGTPIMAPHYHRKFDVAHDYNADTGSCLYCDLLTQELSEDKRVIARTDQFTVFHPFASRVPFETWIMPNEHSASFGLFPLVHFSELARILKDTLFCLHQELDDPAFNLMVDTSTTQDEEDPYYHWHIRIVPRITTIAGFEMGSGIYVNTALPEQTATTARQCALSCLKSGQASPEPKV